MAGNGLVWNEALPDDDVVANEIDDYNRDLRVGIRSRMAREHVWSSSQTATNEAGHHNFVTLQVQTAAPVMAGTTGGALWVKSSDKGIYVTDSGASDYLLVASAKGLAVIPAGTGTQGDVIIGSSANGYRVTRLAGSADGYVLTTHSTTGAPDWRLIADLLGSASIITTMIKTTTGEVTDDISTGTGGEYGVIGDYNSTQTDYTTELEIIGRDGGYGEYVTLPGGTYAFFPQFKRSGATGYWQTRYVTASGQDLWIFLLVDKTTKEIKRAYQAPDHPAYGNGGDFGKMPHPFGSYNKDRYDVVLIDKKTCLVLKTESEQTGKSILTLIHSEYKPNLDANETYQPLHSGRFLGNELELVENIPNYIKIRRLDRLTQSEKDSITTIHQQRMLELQEKRQLEALIDIKKRELAIVELKKEGKIK